MEVYICPWWSGGLVVEGVVVGYGEGEYGEGYRLYRGSSCLDGGVCWTTYTFVGGRNRLSVRDLDVMRFVQAIPDSQIQTLHLAAIQTGYRFYTGKGSFHTLQANISTPPSSPLPTPLLSQPLHYSLLTFISIPNINLLLRMVSLLRTVD